MVLPYECSLNLCLALKFELEAEILDPCIREMSVSAKERDVCIRRMAVLERLRYFRDVCIRKIAVLERCV